MDEKLIVCIGVLLGTESTIAHHRGQRCGCSAQSEHVFPSLGVIQSCEIHTEMRFGRIGQQSTQNHIYGILQEEFVRFIRKSSVPRGCYQSFPHQFALICKDKKLSENTHLVCDNFEHHSTVNGFGQNFGRSPTVVDFFAGFGTPKHFQRTASANGLLGEKCPKFLQSSTRWR